MPARKFVAIGLFEIFPAVARDAYDVVREKAYLRMLHYLIQPLGQCIAERDDISGHVGDTDLESGVVLLNLAEFVFE